KGQILVFTEFARIIHFIVELGLAYLEEHENKDNTCQISNSISLLALKNPYNRDGSEKSRYKHFLGIISFWCLLQ
ncbi:hypothetical protein, partial [Pradoshia sp.]|uniref:hypothetical protein n=1 Tax=Pradoshia sp. TaxID=2651281 RepID=UPI003F0AC1F7